MSMTKSSKPNLRHLKRSLTIRHFLIPPMACSTRIRKLDIFPFSCFWAWVNSLPFGFFAGIFTVTLSGICPTNPVSCHKVIPLGNANGCSSIIFLSWTWPSQVFDSHRMRLSGVQSRSFFTLWVFFSTVTGFLPVRILRTFNRPFRPVEQYIPTLSGQIFNPQMVPFRQFPKGLKRLEQDIR